MSDISKDLIPGDGIVAMVSAGCASAFLYDRPINLIVVTISIYLAGNWVFLRSFDIFSWRGGGARFRRLQQKSDLSREKLKAVLRERERPVVLEDIAMMAAIALAVMAAAKFGFFGFLIILVFWPIRILIRSGQI